MGNSAGIELGCIQLYNSTPFVLDISVDHRRYVNEPSRSRLTTVDKVSSENRFVEVRALDPDDRSRVIKLVSFISRRQHAWIISDVEIRRQMPGNPMYIADDWSTETVDDRKHFTWIPATTSFGDDKTRNNDLRPLVRSDEEYFVHDDVTNTYIVIFNDSPYFLDISVASRPTSVFSRSSVDKTDQERFYRSDPRLKLQTADGERLVSLNTGGDRYPLVRITAVSLLGLEGDTIRCKQAEFYAKNGTAWIVNDECIRRQAGSNRPPYVATVCDAADETAPADMSLSDKWSKADRIKRYDWIQTDTVRPVADAVDASTVTSGLTAVPEPRYGSGVGEEWIGVELVGVTGESNVDVTATGGAVTGGAASDNTVIHVEETK